jgi:hypothetical protein
MKLSVCVFSVCFALLAGCGDDAPPPDPLPNGDVCEVGEGCESGLCVTDLGDYHIEDGMCTSECDLVAQTGCDILTEMCLKYNPTGEQFCYQLCESHEDCREGWECYNFGWLIPLHACIPEDI